MKSKIGVIILNYNSYEDTINEINTCNSLLKVPFDDIVVVDNCSLDNSVEILKTKSNILGFVILQSNVNNGYGAGNNIGMKYLKEKGYKYALILNNDIIIKDVSLISKLLNTFENNEKIAIVNPDIYSLTGHLYNRDSIKPSLYDLTFGIVDYRKKGRILNIKNGYGFVYRPQGCCMMVDLYKMNEIDYFDENIFLYNEELVLAEKLLKGGYLCACNTNISVIHNHSKIVRKTFSLKKIIKINNDSLKYYLANYRDFNSIEILVCLIFNTLKLLVLNRAIQ